MTPARARAARQSGEPRARAARQSGEPATKFAVLGKGGSGKTVLASLMVRAFAEQGSMVLAVDLDANPGLAVSLGIPPDDIALPESAVEQRSDAAYGWGLARHLTAAEAVRRYGTRVTEKVVFLGYGNMAGVDTPLHRYLSAVRQVAQDFREPGWVVVADLASGPTNVFEGYARLAGLALVSVEATPASMLTARRLLEILAHDGVPAVVVVTKARSGDDVRRVRDSLPAVTGVPFDPEVGRLARAGSLAGLDAQSPALRAVRDLVAQLGSRP